MRHFRDLSFLGRRVDRAARLVANARVLLSLDLQVGGTFHGMHEHWGACTGRKGVRVGR